VAREMSWETPTAVKFDRDRFERFRGKTVSTADGRLTAVE